MDETDYLTPEEVAFIHEQRPRTPALIVSGAYKKWADRGIVTTDDGILMLTPWALERYHKYRLAFE